MLEVDAIVLGLEGLEYWRRHVGYALSAGEIHEEDVEDDVAFLSRIHEALATI